MNRIKGNADIRKNIVITVLVALFIVGIILIFYNKLYDANREIIMRNGERSARDIADSFDDYLLTGSSAVKLTAYTVESMMAENRSNKEIGDYLVEQTVAITDSVFENTADMYGYINGEFLDGIFWKPPADFDPTVRPWYLKAVEKKGEVGMIKPYLDLRTGKMMMAITKLLADGKSVVSMDITLDAIQETTEKAVSAGQSDLQFILDGEGYVVAHSIRSEIGKDYSTESSSIGAVIFQKLRESVGSEAIFFELPYGGEEHIVYVTRLTHDFFCVSVEKTSSVYAPLKFLVILTALAVVAVLVIILLMMMNSNKKQFLMETMGKRLSAAADIYISMDEVDLPNDSITEIYNKGRAQTSGEARTNATESLLSVYENVTDQLTKAQMLEFVDLRTLPKRLKTVNTISNEFKTTADKWRRARFIASERADDGTVVRAMFLIEDIDVEKRVRDVTLETVKTMNSQISSVAKVYFSMHEVDLTRDILHNIRTRVAEGEKMPPASVDHAQQIAFESIEHTTNVISRERMHAFVDFTTIDERCHDTDVLTEEFLNCDNEWCRARLVVSGRSADGRVEQILWLIESIDEEKRRRDDLAETAQMLTARISSIANIYMFAYEVDLEADTFTPIKTDRRYVRHVVGEAGADAREGVIRAMVGHLNERNKDDVLRFLDLSTLTRRLGRSDTVSIEYENMERQWRRMRFVASRRDVEGHLTHVIWLVEDIDHEKKERDKLLDLSEKASAANDAKSSFLSNISRELKLPLDDMIDTNEKIYNESGDEAIRSYADRIRSSGAALNSLVHAIHDFSRLEAGEVAINSNFYDLSLMVADLVNMIRIKTEQKGITLETDIGKGIPRMLHGDELHIKQVIGSLLLNAVEYTEEGTVIFCVDYEKIPDEPESVILNIAVIDTGAGIRKEDMHRLHDDFDIEVDEFGRRLEGTGLGMNVTKRLLELMDSQLSVESIYGMGSKFSFELKQTVVKW